MSKSQKLKCVFGYHDWDEIIFIGEKCFVKVCKCCNVANGLYTITTDDGEIIDNENTPPNKLREVLTGRTDFHIKS